MLISSIDENFREDVGDCFFSKSLNGWISNIQRDNTIKISRLVMDVTTSSHNLACNESNDCCYHHDRWHIPIELFWNVPIVSCFLAKIDHLKSLRLGEWMMLGMQSPSYCCTTAATATTGCRLLHCILSPTVQARSIATRARENYTLRVELPANQPAASKAQQQQHTEQQSFFSCISFSSP